MAPSGASRPQPPALALTVLLALALVCHGSVSGTAFPQHAAPSALPALKELSFLSEDNGTGYTELEKQHKSGTPGVHTTSEDLRSEVMRSEGGERGRLPARRVLMEMDKRRRFAAALRRRKPDECWSRRERHLFLKKSPMSEALVDALKKYQEMHRRCTSVEDWGAYAKLLYEGKDRGDKKGCKYAIYVDPPGMSMGTRILSLVSTFAMALVTDRALLVNHDSPMASLFCSPFKLSSWVLQHGQWKGLIDDLWPGMKRLIVLQTTDNVWKGWPDRRMMHIDIRWNSAHSSSLFFCPESHKSVLRHIPVLSVESDQYYVPGLHYLPDFDRELRRLFPDGRVFLHLARALLHPNNAVWSKATEFYNANLAGHRKILGIQVKNFQLGPQPVDERVLECASDVSGVLFEEDAVMKDLFTVGRRAGVGAGTGSEEGRSKRLSTSVFVSSSPESTVAVLDEHANTGKPLKGALVYSLPKSAHGIKLLRVWEPALVEITIFAMCDQLLITDVSPFGQVVAGLSGETPYAMNIADSEKGSWRTNRRPVCVQASSEPCFLRFPGATLTCASGTKELTKINPDVGTCDKLGAGLAFTKQT